MNWIDWILLGFNAVAYAIGHYHGNNRGVAKAAGIIGTAADTINLLSQANQQDQQDAQAARAGTAAGAAAHSASVQAGPPKAS